MSVILTLLVATASPVPEDSSSLAPASPVPEDSSSLAPASPGPEDSSSLAPASPVPEDSSSRVAPAPVTDPRQARRVRFVDAAPLDVLGTGARAAGGWAGAVQLGWPWWSLRGQVGVAPRLALLGEVETALARRWRPALGVSLRWVDRKHFRLGGEVLLGWLVQGEPLVRRGPSGELRMRMTFPVGRIAPYLSVGTQHAVLPDRTRIIGADGTDTQWSARHEWTPKASLGLAVVCTQHLAFDLGIDLAWVDAPRTIALPGLHLGVLFGGGPRGAQR